MNNISKAKQTVRDLMVSRSELLEITLVLDRTQTATHRAALKAIDGYISGMLSDDTQTIRYKFQLDYLVGAEQRLASISSIAADTGVVLEASLDELRDGESILVSLLDRIREMQRVIGLRKI